MTTTTNVSQVKLNIMTQSQYNSATKNANELYMITDAKVDYNDLSNKPTIPTVNDATLTIQKNGTDVATFTANSSTNQTANITVPTDTGDLTNGAGFITGITSGDVTTALGYTPYDASNPNGYTSNTGTVTSVNNVSPVNGNVSLSIPTVNDSTITIQKNGTTVDSFTTNASSGKTINITVPTTASDVGALPDSTVIPTVNNPTITITQGGVTKGSFTLNQSSGDTIALDAAGSSYTAGNGIDITSNVISNTGVRSVSTGTNNGTISVDTNGTSAEVSVAGLGSAAFKSMTSTYDSTGTDPVDGVAVASAISDRADTSLSNLSSDGEKLVARVGMLIPFAGSTAPSGWLICDGSAVSRTTYASLFAVIGTTYGTGDGSTTFNLPNFTDRVIQGGNVGTYKTAGLPDIKGTMGGGAGATGNNAGGFGIIRDSDTTGAFSPYGRKQFCPATATRGWAGTDNNASARADFKASSYNSIYGGSTTVQPPALCVNICIKY